MRMRRPALLLARCQLEPALTALQRALARRPDDDDVRLDAAGILDRLGRRAEAHREYARLAAGPHTPPAIRRAAQERLR